MLYECKGNIHKPTRWATRRIYPSKELGVEVKEENLEEDVFGYRWKAGEMRDLC